MGEGEGVRVEEGGRASCYDGERCHNLRGKERTFVNYEHCVVCLYKINGDNFLSLYRGKIIHPKQGTVSCGKSQENLSEFSMYKV